MTKEPQRRGSNDGYSLTMDGYYAKMAQQYGVCVFVYVVWKFFTAIYSCIYMFDVGYLSII